MTAELSPEKVQAIHDAVFAGNKIEAIKLYRMATGMDLKDSKAAIEKLTDDLRVQYPAMFARQRKQGGSLATLIFWGAIVAVIVYLVLRWS